MWLPPTESPTNGKHTRIRFVSVDAKASSSDAKEGAVEGEPPAAQIGPGQP